VWVTCYEALSLEARIRCRLYDMINTHSLRLHPRLVRMEQVPHDSEMRHKVLSLEVY
jgi:hypothetical protein